MTDLSRVFFAFPGFGIEQLSFKFSSCLLQSISLHVVKRNVLNVLTLLIKKRFCREKRSKGSKASDIQSWGCVLVYRCTRE